MSTNVKAAGCTVLFFAAAFAMCLYPIIALAPVAVVVACFIAWVVVEVFQFSKRVLTADEDMARDRKVGP